MDDDRPGKGNAVNPAMDWSSMRAAWHTGGMFRYADAEQASLILERFSWWNWSGVVPGIALLVYFGLRGAWIATAETLVAMAILEVNRRWVLGRKDGSRAGTGVLVWSVTLIAVIVVNSFTTGGDLALSIIVLFGLPFALMPVGGLRGGVVAFVGMVGVIFIVHGVHWIWDIPQELVPTSTDRLVVHIGLLVATTFIGAQAFVGSEQSKQLIREHAAELAVARDQAMAVSHAKSDFLATMSHELRTPLHGVTAALDLLDRDDLPPDVRRRVDIALACAGDATRVVNDIVDFSRIEAEGLETDEVPFSPAELVTQSVDVVRALAERKGLTLQSAVADDVPPLLAGDADKLRRVLVNLLGNAVKFTSEGGVAIAVRWSDGNLWVAVSDTGVGIAADAQERLFEQFEQADSSTTRRFGGSGLGLAISRRLVQHLGGDITVESQPDIGSRFSFTVPMAPARGEGAVTLVPLPALPVPIEAEITERGPSGGPLVLVVDDLAVNASLIGEVLEVIGCRSLWAPDGPTALAEVETRPDIAAVLLDSHLPGMHGSEIAAAIRRIRGDDIHLLGLTADVSATNLAAAREAGMERVLGKPARLPVIREALRQTGVLATWFDTTPLVEARVLVLADGTDSHTRAVALLEPAYHRAATLVEQLRGEDDHLDVFHRAHGNLVGSLVYAVELARRPDLTEDQRRHLVAFLERAIAWEDA